VRPSLTAEKEWLCLPRNLKFQDRVRREVKIAPRFARSHGDLFCDNVLFDEHRLSGIIGFVLRRGPRTWLKA